jgi:hypothetical protein
VTGGRAILVLHDAGAADGGAPWGAALAAAGWPGAVHAPDLPGHGATPAPTDGAYELVDAALHVLPLCATLEDEAPVVLGVGANGWAAQLLAIGGRAAALVLVDGLGGPWLQPAQAIAEDRARLRAILDDPAAVAAPPPTGLDPRLVHGIGGQTSRDLAVRAAAAITVPTLVLSSPAAALPAVAQRDVCRHLPDVEVVDLWDPGLAHVADEVVRWAGDRVPGAGRGARSAVSAGGDGGRARGPGAGPDDGAAPDRGGAGAGR